MDNRVVLLFATLAGCSTPPAICTPACADGYACVDGTCVQMGADLSAAADGGMGNCKTACGGLTPYCNTGGHCVGCTMDSQCPSGHFCKVVSDTIATCTIGCMSDDRCGGGAMKCCNMQCVDTGADPSNCGACGKACSAPNAQSTCAGGNCQTGACEPGFGDCDGNPQNGCETNLHVDPNNCTACGMKCALTHANVGCADGCYIEACVFGFADCNNNMMDGCETPVLSDPNNCGGCGQSCQGLPNATANCADGNCVLGNCNMGFADCNHNPQDGCEANLNYDSNNCTGCGIMCPMNAPNCVGGVCGQQDLSGVFAKFMSENRTVYIWKTPMQCANLANYTDFCTKRGLAWWRPKSQPDAQMLITFAFNLDMTHTWIQVYGIQTTLGTVGGYSVTVDGNGCVEASPGGAQFGAFRKWACSFCNPASNAQQQDNNQSCCWDKTHPYDWFVCEG